MGPHIRQCVQLVWKHLNIHPLTCTCSFELAQAARRREENCRRSERMRSRGPTITVNEVECLKTQLDLARVQGRYRDADSIRAELDGFGISVQCDRLTSRYFVRGGHRVIGYHGWEF